MKMTPEQKHNLLEFLNRTQLVGKEAVTLVNLQYAIANAEEEKDTASVDGKLS